MPLVSEAKSSRFTMYAYLEEIRDELGSVWHGRGKTVGSCGRCSGLYEEKPHRLNDAGGIAFMLWWYFDIW